MEKLGVGIIGLRHLHPRDYLPLFEQVPETEVVAVAESDKGMLKEFTSENKIKGYEDWHELLEREDVDIVAIFLPHAQCPEAVEVAASRGKHIIVEKPMASTSAGIRRMITAAQTHGVKLSTPYLWRYNIVSRELKRLIADGALGDIIACEGRCAAGKPSRYLELSPWILDKELSGGGPMHNLGVHWIDLFRWLFQDDIVSIQGTVTRNTPDITVEDGSFALAKFSKGAVGIIDISYSVPASFPYGRDLYVGIRGTKGAVSWSPAFGGIGDELFVCSEAPGYADAPLRNLSFTAKAAPGYCGITGVEYIKDFVAAIRQDKEPVISAEDGAKALDVVEAFYRAAESGREVSVG
jgi:UDP-N-acetyl-2-amino-2-deoxyglucuronate dehydrogenase